MTSGIEPTPIGQTANSHSMRAAAALANARVAFEPHAPADLGPIVGIGPPHLRPDRHSHPPLR
jgi:hypothetical protein